MIFCDTSAIAKLYVAERESEAVRLRLEAEDRILVSEFGRMELMQVFHRQFREGRWSRDGLLAAVRQFSTDDARGLYTWLPVDREISLRSAETFLALSPKVFLRAGDCIHLVTAVANRIDEICTYDRHQSAAAPALGLKAIAIE